MLAGSGLYYYVVDEYKVSNELLTEDVYVSRHGDRTTLRDITAYTRCLGTPICSPEARGLRQGPRAGGQVEEVGVQQKPARQNIERRRTGEDSRLLSVWKETRRASSSLYMYIPSSPQTNNSKYLRICSELKSHSLKEEIQIT